MGTHYICTGCKNERGCDILGECFTTRTGAPSSESFEMAKILKRIEPNRFKVTQQQYSRDYHKQVMKRYKGVKPDKRKHVTNKAREISLQQKELFEKRLNGNKFYTWIYANGWDKIGNDFYTDGVKNYHLKKLRQLYEQSL